MKIKLKDIEALFVDRNDTWIVSAEPNVDTEYGEYRRRISIRGIDKSLCLYGDRIVTAIYPYEIEIDIDN